MKLNSMLSTPITIDDVEAIMNALDENKDGRLSYDEFINGFKVVDTVQPFDDSYRDLPPGKSICTDAHGPSYFWSLTSCILHVKFDVLLLDQVVVCPSRFTLLEHHLILLQRLGVKCFERYAVYFTVCFTPFSHEYLSAFFGRMLSFLFRRFYRSVFLCFTCYQPMYHPFLITCIEIRQYTFNLQISLLKWLITWQCHFSVAGLRRS